ncbi:ThuA-like domain-containing protein [Hypoxylon sp. FL0890]|nr:ThuA-like domain-containing protein [Hypoxylon sp. FL0890]
MRGLMASASSASRPVHLTLRNLSKCAVVIFLQTSGDFLSKEQLAALQTYVRGGGGFVGIHCAAAGMMTEPWYGELIGAVFTDHPGPQRGILTIENKDNAIVAGLPEEWEWFDEWYNFNSNPRAEGDRAVVHQRRDFKL